VAYKVTDPKVTLLVGFNVGIINGDKEKNEEFVMVTCGEAHVVLESSEHAH